jgi:G:T-mismatch repair DNA endonuclease (very short patch repair protein)
VHPDTIRRWFVDLATEADVLVGGDVPTPKTARRYWYSSYSTAMARIMEDMEQIADEQGSASGRVVWESYLSEEDRRRRRQQEMMRELGDAFR